MEEAFTFEDNFSKFVINISLTNGYATHTYKIGHYNTSVRIIDLVSLTTYVVYIDFI